MSELCHIISQLPAGWQCLFGALTDQKCPLVAAEIWLSNTKHSQYLEQELSDWSVLVTHLSDMKPVEPNGDLFKL